MSIDLFEGTPYAKTPEIDTTPRAGEDPYAGVKDPLFDGTPYAQRQGHYNYGAAFQNAPRSSDPLDFLKPVSDLAQNVGDFAGSLLRGDPNAKDEPVNFLGGQLNRGASNLPFVGGALQGLGTLGGLTTGTLAGIPAAFSSPAAAAAQRQGRLTLGGDEPSPFDIFAAARGLQAASAERSGELATRAGDTSLSLPDRAFSKSGSLFYGAAPLAGSLPLVGEIAPAARAFRGGLAGDLGRAAEDVRAPITMADLQRGVVASRAPEGVPARGGFVETTPPPNWATDTEPRGFTDRPPITLADLRPSVATASEDAAARPSVATNEALATARGQAFEPGTGAALRPLTLPERPIGGLTARGISTTPIGREDLTLTGSRFAPPAETPPRLSLADLRARTGGPETITTDSGFTLGVRETAVHDANEGLISAMRDAVAAPRSPSKWAAVQDASQKLTDLGASIDHTSDRLRQAGLPGLTADQIRALGSPRRDALATLESSGVIRGRGAPIGETNVPQAAPVPTGGAGLLGGLGRAIREETGGGPLPGDKGRYGTPEEVNIARRAYEARVAAQKAAGAWNPENPINFGTERTQGAGYPGARGASDRGPLLAGSSPSGGSRIPLAPRKIDMSRLAENVLGIPKTLTTAASPMHFLGRQALPFAAAHPQAWLKGAGAGLDNLAKTPEQVAARIQFMKYNLKENGFGNAYIGSPHAGIVGGEEAVASRFLNKIPVIGGVIQRSGQGFTMGLNEIRYAALKGITDAAERSGRPLTALEKQGLADTINHFSGRGIDIRPGEVGTKADVVRFMNMAMFTPQLASARVRMIGDTINGLATLTKDVVTRQPLDRVALERARLGAGYLIGVSATYALAAARGLKVDMQPDSTTFGRIDIGPTGQGQWWKGALPSQFGMGDMVAKDGHIWVDPTASESGLIRTLAREYVRFQDQLNGTHNLKTDMGSKQEATYLDILGHYLQGLLAPVPYQAVEAAQGYGVDPLNVVLPMTASGALNAEGIQTPKFGAFPKAAPKITTADLKPRPKR